MAIDILIVNYFSAKDVVRAIETLGCDPQWTYWVIDNSADDTEWGQLQQAMQHSVLVNPQLSVHLERSGENLGFGRACNALFAKGHASYCLLLNPDARITTPALKHLLAQAQKRSDLGALAPVMYSNEECAWVIPKMLAQSAGQFFYEALMRTHQTVYQWLWRHYYQSEQRQLEQTGLLMQRYLSGAIVLLQRAAIMQASRDFQGIFDPRYFMFFEDADLSRRLVQEKFNLAIDREVKAVHQYQHHASKNALMQTSHTQYAKRYFPWLSWLRRYWTSLDASPQWLETLYAQEPQAHSLEQLNAILGQRQLIAWSPSPLVIPALWRSPLKHQLPSFSQTSWDGLAPGHYYGVACQPNLPNDQLSWLRFTR